MHAKQARTMAAYNRWINERLYDVCATLTDDERKADRRAFFGQLTTLLSQLGLDYGATDLIAMPEALWA